MSLLNTLIPSKARAAAEQSGSTERTVKPAYQITETEDAYRVTVNLPGIAKDGLEITADGEEVRIAGRRTWTQPAGWTAVHRETPRANYALTLTHDNLIDGDKIGAELRDGVLNLTLPKQEKAKPRKIAVA